eukprot:3610104-Amphidinium_carterae.1
MTAKETPMQKGRARSLARLTEGPQACRHPNRVRQREKQHAAQLMEEARVDTKVIPNGFEAHHEDK